MHPRRDPPQDSRAQDLGALIQAGARVETRRIFYPFSPVTFRFQDSLPVSPLYLYQIIACSFGAGARHLSEVTVLSSPKPGTRESLGGSYGRAFKSLISFRSESRSGREDLASSLVVDIWSCF